MKEEAMSEQREVARLARGVMAGVQLRLLSGATATTYTPNDVAKMVSEVIDDQIARLEREDQSPPPERIRYCRTCGKTRFVEWPHKDCLPESQP